MTKIICKTACNNRHKNNLSCHKYRAQNETENAKLVSVVKRRLCNIDTYSM